MHNLLHKLTHAAFQTYMKESFQQTSAVENALFRDNKCDTMPFHIPFQGLPDTTINFYFSTRVKCNFAKLSTPPLLLHNVIGTS